MATVRNDGPRGVGKLATGVAASVFVVCVCGVLIWLFASGNLDIFRVSSPGWRGLPAVIAVPAYGVVVAVLAVIHASWVAPSAVGWAFGRHVACAGLVAALLAPLVVGCIFEFQALNGALVATLWVLGALELAVTWAVFYGLFRLRSRKPPN